jgi:hypothetical protein
MEANEVRDQTILKLIENSKTDSRMLLQLAELITDSSSASDAFEEFGSSFTADGQLNLLSGIYAVMRERWGARASSERSPGFFAPWRLIRDQERPETFAPWITDELEKCIPGHLRLLKDIYYYWLGSDRHNKAEREKPRHVIWKSLKHAWEQMPPSIIADGFDPTFPYTLFHIIFTSDCERPDTVPYGRVEDWTWTGRILLEACHLSPQVMIPQVVFALHQISAELSREADYRFDDHVLNCLFGQNVPEVLRLIANGFAIDQGIDAQSAYLLRLAMERAKQRKDVLSDPTFPYSGEAS